MSEATKSVFVVSAIGAKGSEERRHADMTLNAIIRPALAASGFNCIVKRGDEDSKVGMITDHIISDISEADLIVADLTFLNPNVMYEVGIADAMEKHVVQIATVDTKLPFDTQGYRVIKFTPSDWHSQEETKLAIKKSAQDSLSGKTVLSNPVTHARGVNKAATSADGTSQLLTAAISQIDLHEQRLVALERRWRPQQQNPRQRDISTFINSISSGNIESGPTLGEILEAAMKKVEEKKT